MELGKKLSIPILSTLLLVFILFGISSCDMRKYKYLQQKEGILDLRYFDFKNKREPISLDGEWLFYWEEFIMSDPSTSIQEPILLKTQESWYGKDIDTEILPRFGYGSYYMNILLPVDGNYPKLGMKIPQIASSYRLYINRKLAYESGTPSRTREESIPYIRNHYMALDLSEIDRNIEIVFEIANYENDGPGFWQIPKLAPIQNIHKIQVFSTANDLFLFGTLIVMGFYHYGIYFFHRSQKSILFFSYFSYLLALRVIITGERYILELFPFIDWSILFRVEFLDFYLLPISFSIYMYYLFPMETNKKIIHVFSSIVLLFSLTVFLPIYIFTSFAKLFLIFLAFVSFYVLYINIRAVINKRDDALIFIGGLVVLVLTALWDIVQDFMNIRGFSISPYGFLGFVFIQAIVLSSRLASNFIRTESLSLSLSKSNKELTHLKKILEDRVEERTEKLQSTIAVIKKDLGLAKSIQSKLIPTQMHLWDNLEIHSLYRPMEEVGGDIFDITEFDHNRKRIFLADALGHGVQAALLTMAIKSEYEGVKNISYSPRDAIRNLSASFFRKFSSLHTYFSCVVVDIDLEKNRIIYASAGHPNQVLVSKDTLIELQKTSHILGLDKVLEVDEKEYPFYPGDRVFLFSDGAIEEFNSKKEIRGEGELYKQIMDSHRKNSPIPEIFRIFEEDLSRFMEGSKLQDDLTLIGIARTG